MIRSYPASARDCTFSSRFVPSAFDSMTLVFSTQITPSAIALSRATLARSLNPLSPSPPTSSASPTLMSLEQDPPSPLELPPDAVLLLSLHAAPMSATTTTTAQPVQFRERMPAPP